MSNQNVDKRQEVENLLRGIAYLILDYSKNLRHHPCEQRLYDIRLPWIKGIKVKIIYKNGKVEIKYADKIKDEYILTSDGVYLPIPCEEYRVEVEGPEYIDKPQGYEKDTARHWVAQEEGIKPEDVPQETVNKALAEVKEYEKLWYKMQNHLEELRQQFKKLTQDRLVEPFGLKPQGKDMGYVREQESLCHIDGFISVAESRYNEGKNPLYYASFDDFLKEELRKQTEEYLQKWDKEIKALIPAGAGKEKGGTDVETTTTVKLKLRVTTRETYWEDVKQATLPKTPYSILYALAVRPGQILPYNLLMMFLGEALQVEKAVSKHKNTITARIPPLDPYIETDEGNGLSLNLAPEEVKIIGNIDYVDSQLVTYEARQIKGEHEMMQKKYKRK